MSLNELRQTVPAGLGIALPELRWGSDFGLEVKEGTRVWRKRPGKAFITMKSE